MASENSAIPSNINAQSLMRKPPATANTELLQPHEREHEAKLIPSADSQVWLMPSLQEKKGKISRAWDWTISESWFIEYGACVLATVAFGCVIAVLKVYDDRPSSEWKYSVSLNAVLSTISTVMKGAILLPVGSCLSQLKWCWYHHDKRPLQDFSTFDAASRGPLGAVALLYNLRFWHMASLGSAVSLLALANDVFVQQSVAYPQRRLMGSATIPMAQSYALMGLDKGFGAYDFEPSMLSAIYDGILYSNISVTAAAMTAKCGAANCTFPDYASLGICSSCKNTTSLIQPICEPMDMGTYGPAFGNCSWLASLPNGLELGNGEGYVMLHDYRYNVINISTKGGLSSDMPVSHQSVLNITMLLSDVNLTTRGYSSPEGYNAMYDNTIAYDCMLYFCVRKYSGSVVNDIFSETVIGQYTPSDEEFDRFGNVNLTMDAITIPANDLPEDVNATFAIGEFIYYSFNYNLQRLLAGNGTGNDDSDYQLFSSDLVEAIFLNGPMNVPHTIANLATSMTNNMRQKSGDFVQGHSETSTTYIHVRWLWLVPSSLLVVTTLLFLSSTVWQTKRYVMPLWKSSALAILLHEVQIIDGRGDVQIHTSAVVRRRTKVSQLEEWSKDINAELDR